MEKTAKKVIGILLKNKIEFNVEYREGNIRVYIPNFTLSILFYKCITSMFNLGKNKAHGTELFECEVIALVNAYIKGDL